MYKRIVDFGTLVSIVRSSNKLIDPNKLVSELNKIISEIDTNLSLKSSIGVERALELYTNMILILDTIEDNTKGIGREVDHVREAITSWMANTITHTCLK